MRTTQEKLEDRTLNHAICGRFGEREMNSLENLWKSNCVHFTDMQVKRRRTEYLKPPISTLSDEMRTYLDGKSQQWQAQRNPLSDATVVI